MPPYEVTKTANVPVWFPDKKRKRKDKKMNEAELAVWLVEEYAMEYRDALDVVLEVDMDKAAKKMAKKAAPDDDDKQKELESKYKEQMKRMSSRKRK